MRTKQALEDRVNPLQRMFGVFLRLERGRLGKNSAEVAQRFGVSDTYLRLVEAGKATLNQSLVFRIIAEYADTTAPTHDTRTIIFNRLAIFMVGLHWVGAEMNHRSDRDAMKSLAEEVSDFEVLYSRTKRYFDLKDETSKREFLELVAAPEIDRFLRSPDYLPLDQKSIEDEILPRSELLKMPGLNIEFLFEIKQALQGRSFVHGPNAASEWESRRAAQFRKVRGVFSKIHYIVDEGNLEHFHYDYLSHVPFEEFNMVFIEHKDEAAIKADFITLLNAGRTKSSRLGPLSKDEEEKVHIRCLNAEETKRYKDQLEQLRCCADGEDPMVPLEAFWSFETFTGLQVGFVGLLKANRDRVTNLTFQESFEKAEMFDKLWSELNSARKN